ncbi:hypothetical protein Tsubulata_009677 [Turnera subulata]|uniref:CCHC-type domain-containing protein n=1 Tax=Turnera subulata TaxID=218843 RepID=A0A9Q0GHN3_9ROSI|nr:hypothetical protein Tsubulata_009677 [Turnera subulata]
MAKGRGGVREAGRGNREARRTTRRQRREGGGVRVRDTRGEEEEGRGGGRGGRRGKEEGEGGGEAGAASGSGVPAEGWWSVAARVVLSRGGRKRKKREEKKMCAFGMKMEFHEQHKRIEEYMEPIPVIEFESEGEEPVSRESPILVGKIIANFKRFSIRTVAEALLKVRSLKKPVEVTEANDNMFVFKFTSIPEKERILAGSPWTFSGFLFCLKDWLVTVSLADLNFDVVPMWIKVQGLTPNLMTRSRASKIVSHLFMGVEEIALPVDNSPHWGDSFKMKVQVNLLNPLPTGFMNKKKGDEADWISFHYDNLGDYCYYCARVGHCEKDCPEIFEVRKQGRIRSEICGVQNLRSTRGLSTRTITCNKTGTNWQPQTRGTGRATRGSDAQERNGGRMAPDSPHGLVEDAHGSQHKATEPEFLYKPSTHDPNHLKFQEKEDICT